MESRESCLQKGNNFIILSEFSSFLCFLNFYFALLQAALFKLLTCVGVNSVEFKQQQRLSGRQHTLYFHVICPFPSQCSRESGCRKSILGLYLVYKLWKQMLKQNSAFVHLGLGKAFGKTTSTHYCYTETEMLPDISEQFCINFNIYVLIQQAFIQLPVQFSFKGLGRAQGERQNHQLLLRNDMPRSHTVYLESGNKFQGLDLFIVFNRCFDNYLHGNGKQILQIKNHKESLFGLA